MHGRSMHQTKRTMQPMHRNTNWVFFPILGIRHTKRCDQKSIRQNYFTYYYIQERDYMSEPPHIPKAPKTQPTPSQATQVNTQTHG